MTTFSAILLAAGQSRRMGSINKLELPIGNIPLLRHSAEVLLRAGMHEIIVVVGAEEQTSRQLLSDLPLTIVDNNQYHEGQMTSVDRGISAVQTCDAFFICLADLPLIDTADLEQMMQAFIDTDKSLLVPHYRGQRGNPVIIDFSHREAILNADSGQGCRGFIDTHPELVMALEMTNDHVVFDVDTPEAYQLLLERLNLEQSNLPISESA